MIDFGALVLGPAMAVFGQPITVTPTASKPGVPPYPARGVFRAQDASLQQSDGTVVATTDYTLGLRLSDYLVPPIAGDGIAVAGFSTLVDRVHPDGQGGAILTLKRIAP